MTKASVVFSKGVEESSLLYKSPLSFMFLFQLDLASLLMLPRLVGHHTQTFHERFTYTTPDLAHYLLTVPAQGETLP